MKAADLPEVPFETPKSNGAHESFEDAKPVEVPREQRGAAPPGMFVKPVLSQEERDRAIRSGLEAAEKMDGERLRTPVNIGRTLPHSLEAEEYLLSACLLDGSLVIERCIEEHIRAESFYDPKHGTIFELLVDLHRRQKPIEVSVLAEELKTLRQLDAVGGYAFLTQVSARLPTTAQASYFIETVRQQSILREAIRTATGFVEEAYNFTGGIDEFLGSLAKRTAHLVETGTASSVLTEFAIRRAGMGRKLKDEVPVLFLKDIPIANRSNLGLLTALKKSGKSASVGAIIGAFIADPNHKGDTLGFRAANPHGHALIHWDTEQSPKDHEGLIDISKIRGGVSQIPPWLYSYGVKGIGADALRQKYRKMMRELSRRHGGICLSILDGCAEFVCDPNDPKECNPFVTELESLATDYDCHILNVLHLNPFSGPNTASKSRGHLGSQLERKCETDIRLTQDKDGVTTMFTACSRHAPIFEKDGLRFSWDNNAKMHLSCAGSSPKLDAKREKLSNLADAVFVHSGKSTLRYGDIIKALQEVARISADHAGTRFTEIKKAGLIRQDMVGGWSQNQIQG